MPDPFESRVSALHDPARDIFPVTPSDAADLPQVAVGLYVEQGGALRIDTVAGQTRSLVVGNLSLLPVGVRRVHATGTTALGLHGLAG